MSFRKKPQSTGMNMKIFFCAGSSVEGVIACCAYIDAIIRMTRT